MEHTYNESTKRLTRSSKDKVFGGVCGGLADYLDIDPVLVRVLCVGLTLISGVAPGIVLYLISWIIIPIDTYRGEVAPSARGGERMSGRKLFGVLLIVVGLIVLTAMALPFSLPFSIWFGSFESIGPLLLIVGGIVLIIWKREPAASSGDYTVTSEGDAPKSEYHASSAYNTESTMDDTQPRRMYRLERERKIAGVCSGLGEYFKVDPTIIRIVFILLAFSGGTGILLYLIMWLVMPLRVDTPVILSGEAKN